MAKKFHDAILYAFCADRTAEAMRAKGFDRNYTSIMAIGDFSSGKTATAVRAAKTIAKALKLKPVLNCNSPADDEFGITFADLSGDTAESIAGIPEVVVNPETGKPETVVHAHPWVPRRGRGIVIVDEFNRIQSTASLILQQLADKHKLGPHLFNEGWTVLFIANPPEGATGEIYSVNDGSFDQSFYSRNCIIPVTIGKAEWMDYALDQRLNPAVINYEAITDDTTGQKVEEGGIDIDKLFRPSRCSRSRETVSNLIDGSVMANELFGLPVLDKASDDEDVEGYRTTMLAHLVSGCFGSKSAVAFVKSLTMTEKPLSAEAIVNGYATVQDADGQTPQERVRRWSDPGNLKQRHLAHVTVSNVIRYIADLEFDNPAVKAKFEKFDLKNIDLMLDDVSEEEVLLFIRKLQQDVGPRGIEILKVLQKHNKRVLEGIR